MRYVMALIVGVLAFVSGRNCIAADDCAFRTATKCYSCDEPDAIMVGSSEECTKTCPNREINTRGSGSGAIYVLLRRQATAWSATEAGERPGAISKL